nr:MAG TPA: hypothetical protein [Caudoviricetes sp.]DAK23705.1 MAG TPA: hypothetical protein [Caudoviricetes sp.]DAN01439.1 MAG TPA: hypothetical protein [Caudoviricetes sp.]DAS55856.1 MAG TPA: hypothetical protein [Caudoviricetes sp.]
MSTPLQKLWGRRINISFIYLYYNIKNKKSQ